MTLPLVSGEFRAGADPNLRFSPGGTAVCGLRAVASSRKKTDAGEWVDDKSAWVDLIGFNAVAEHMAESIAKGDLITVMGKLQVEDWEDSEGKPRKSVKVVVDSIGPSLKYATAKVTKAARSDGGGGGGSAPASSEPNPWDVGTPAGQTEDPPF